MLYQSLKDLIEAGEYEYNDMLKKLDLFKRGGKLTQEQYDELKAMMDNRQLEKESQ